jgi:hypothetical protein
MTATPPATKTKKPSAGADTILKDLRREKQNSKTTLVDPYAWIILQLPKHLWTRGKHVLDELDNHVEWNVLTGEISILSNDFGSESKTISGSNIVDIVRHAVDEGPLEPYGYEKVFRFLPPTSPSPKEHEEEQKQEEKEEEKKKEPKIKTKIIKTKSHNKKSGKKTSSSFEKRNKARTHSPNSNSDEYTTIDWISLEQ